LTYSVQRSQIHSTIPSGSLDLNFEDEKGIVSSSSLPFNVDKLALQQTLESINPVIKVFFILCDVVYKLTLLNIFR
jgi:hypothetical protein